MDCRSMLIARGEIERDRQRQRAEDMDKLAGQPGSALSKAFVGAEKLVVPGSGESEVWKPTVCLIYPIVEREGRDLRPRRLRYVWIGSMRGASPEKQRREDGRTSGITKKETSSRSMAWARFEREQPEPRALDVRMCISNWWTIELLAAIWITYLASDRVKQEGIIDSFIFHALHAHVSSPERQRVVSEHLEIITQADDFYPGTQSGIQLQRLQRCLPRPGAAVLQPKMAHAGKRPQEKRDVPVVHSVEVHPADTQVRDSREAHLDGEPREEVLPCAAAGVPAVDLETLDTRGVQRVEEPGAIVLAEAIGAVNGARARAELAEDEVLDARGSSVINIPWNVGQHRWNGHVLEIEARGALEEPGIEITVRADKVRGVVPADADKREIWKGRISQRQPTESNFLESKFPLRVYEQAGGPRQMWAQEVQQVPHHDGILRLLEVPQIDPEGYRSAFGASEEAGQDRDLICVLAANTHAEPQCRVFYGGCTPLVAYMRQNNGVGAGVVRDQFCNCEYLREDFGREGPD
ncbi:hypothetical protein DFH09DRAFT_1067670 [Mycena vulgaris]|nr:hypothetical protein DFH09DRAFT_1067670 [Mycena vulgaris]